MNKTIIVAVILLGLGLVSPVLPITPLESCAELATDDSFYRGGYPELWSRSFSEDWNSNDFSPSGRFSRFMRANLDTALCQDEDSMEIIIGVKSPFKESYEKVRAVILANPGKVTDTILMEGAPKVVVADVPHEVLSSIRWKLLNQGLARYVEPNMRLRFNVVPNDPEWRINWGLDKLRAPYAWSKTVGEPSVVIAIVDTGVDWNHPDLANNIWNNTDELVDGEDNGGNGFVDDVRGWDFVDTYESVWPGEDGTGRDNDPMDFCGHGTHCAGIAAAIGNNSVGVCGVTWNCKIMPVRAGYKGADGGGYLELDDAAAAIIYAADNGAHIISCSWGEYYNSQIIREAIEYAYEAGVLLVAAAGNEWTADEHYPAAYSEVMAISATNDMDMRAYFSNFGDWIELSAPGTDIYSTMFNDSYDFMSGTSMASPFVAGVAALVWSRFPNMNRNQVREQLHFTSDDLGDACFDVHFGHGRVNALEAVELEQKPHDLAILEMSIDLTVVLGEQVYVDVSVVNMGTSFEHNLIVQLLVNNSHIKTENMALLASGELRHVNFLWDTSQCVEGYYNLTAHAVPVTGENRTENNFLSKNVFVRSPRVINVPADFSTIQTAVDEASEGDTIMVASGRYDENVIIYKDSLKLIGKGTATISGARPRPGDVILVWGANHVEIRDFTVRESWQSSLREPAFSGILVQYCDNVKITNVLAKNNPAGIFLYCSNNVMLRGNRMIANDFNFGVDGVELSNFIHCIDESNTVEDKPLRYLINESNKTVSSPAGCVVLVNCTNIEVKSLELVHNYAGIFCFASGNVTMFDLKASLNHIGVHVLNCFSIIIRNTTMTKNHVGIMVEHSESVTAENNLVSGLYPMSNGILFDHSSKCQARFNILSENAVNLWLYYSNENVVTDNEVFTAAFSGISLTSACNNLVTKNSLFNNIRSIFGDGIALNINMSFNDYIYHNNFINNTYNVFSTDSANMFDDDYPSGGNHWTDYSGTDSYRGSYQNETGSDGIGDTPYVIDENNIDTYPLMAPFGPLTLKGENITVFPIDGVGLIFENVTAEGFTTVNKTETGPDPPSGFKLMEQYYSIKTTANHSDAIAIRIIYDDSNMRKEEENAIKLMQWNEASQEWGDITTRIDTQNNVIYGETSHLSLYGIFGPLMNDVAVNRVTFSKTVLEQGSTLQINITVTNKGDFAESFNLTVYANTTIIATLANITLTTGNSKTVTITWDTASFAKGNYTISAHATPVPDETRTSDNTLTDGWVIVALVGDITGPEGHPDGRCDTRDVGLVARLFGKKYPDPMYQPNCDVVYDLKIDMKDIGTIARHFGETDP